MRCDECKFWSKHKNDSRVLHPPYEVRGYCRRNAPVFTENANGKTWPETATDDWCGEHELIADEDRNEP